MERPRFLTNKRIRMAAAAVGIATLLSTRDNAVSSQPDLSLVQPLACSAAYGEKRIPILALSSEGGKIDASTNENKLYKPERGYEGIKAVRVQGTYGETDSVLALQPFSSRLIKQGDKEVPMQEGQAILCVSESELALLTVASSEIKKPTDENIEWQGVISMNDGEVKSIPHYIMALDASAKNNNKPQIFSALFEMRDARFESNFTSEYKPQKIKNLILSLQQVDKRTDKSLPKTQHVFRVSFSRQ